MAARKIRSTWLNGAAAFALATGVLGVALGACQIDDLTKRPGTEPGPIAEPTLDNAPEGAVLTRLSFTRDVAATVPAGEHVIITYDDKDLAVIDMSDPANPGEPVVLKTNSKIAAVEYDDERQFAYAVDVNGTLWTINIQSAAGAELLAATGTSPALAGMATAIARVGDRVFVLAGTVMVPFAMKLAEGVPVSVTPEAPVPLEGPAIGIAAGAGLIYVAMTNGELHGWSAVSGAPTRVGSVNIGGDVKALLAKGSKVVALSKSVGMKVVDFGSPSDPSLVKTEGSLSDVVNARLFGRTLLIGLERGQVSTLDLSDFAHPVPVTTNKGAIPSFMVVVNGNAVWGSGKEAQVVGVPPVVTAVVPAVIKADFPLNGQIPITFSKPIDVGMATAGAVKLVCNEKPIAGTVVISIDRLTATFRPAVNLPMNTACSVDVSAVKDAQGLPMSQGSPSNSFAFTTSRAAPAPVENPGSKYKHTADGRFTDLPDVGPAGPTAGAQFEWFDVKPAKGMYTYFYADFDGSNLWLMNDWFYNGDNIDPDCYNMFNAWTGGGSERWEIRAYGNQRVEVRKNGTLIETGSSGVEGGAGYVASPNVSTPHTIYELKIPAKPGTWGVQLHDPGPSFNCSKRMGDPTGIAGALAGGAQQSSSSIGVSMPMTAPIAPVLTAPDQGATGLPLMPNLTWRSDNRIESFVGYQVQIARNNTFSQGLWSAGTAGTSFTLPRGVLVGGTTYFWRVTAWNSSGRADSDTRQFTTVTTVKPGEQLLTIAKVGMGTVTSQPAGINCGQTCEGAYAKNTEVVLTAVPAQGWAFQSWTGDCKGEDTMGDAGAGSAQSRVTMTANRTCVATFRMNAETTYTLTAAVVGTGTVTGQGINCPNGTCSTQAVANSTVTLTATPGFGSSFTGWSGSCQGTNNVNSVLMNGNKACTATFTKLTNSTLTVATTPVNGGSVTATNPLGQIANCGNGGTCTGTYGVQTNVTLLATPAQGYRFTSWTGNCDGTETSYVVSMNVDRACTANFVRTWPFIATKTGVGTGTVVMSGSGGGTQSCNTACNTNITANYDEGTNVTLTATPSAASTFTGWSNCSTSTNATISIPATAATTCTANFGAGSTFNLDVQMTGLGTVSGTAGGFTVNCTNGMGVCSAPLPQNTQVTLTATPQQGYTFVNWTNCASTTSSQISITMNSAKTCVANFSSTQPLTITVNGTGRVSDGGAIDCGNGGPDCTASYPLNTNVTLTATPANGNTFSGWSNCSNSTSASIVVAMSTARTCVATFAAAGFTMTVTPAGTGTGSHTVVSTDGNINCARSGLNNSGTCQASYASNAQLTLVASPAADSAFMGWVCNGTNLGTNLSLARTMTANQTCTATFDQRYTLTVAPTPTSSGIVISQDFTTINCGATCTRAGFVPNSTLQITAVPNGGKSFLNWSGTLPGCSGTNATTVLTINATSTCTANFSP